MLFDWYTDFDEWRQDPITMEETDSYNRGDLVCIKGELYRLPANPLHHTYSAS